MGRIYTAAIPHRSVAADATLDLWSLFGASGDVIILHGWQITSSAVAATLTTCTLQRATAVGSGGNGEVETPLNPDDAAASATVTSANGTQSAGLSTDLAAYQWEQLGPLGEVYTPELRPVIRGTNGIILTTETAAAFTMSGWICWEEV